MWKYPLFLLLISYEAIAANSWKDEEETPDYWLNLGREELNEAIKVEQLNKNVAKNVILMLGDGMGMPTITAGRILKGQLEGNSGEETVLAMDKFMHTGLSKTYAVDKQVADSASTATAYLCGVKGNYYTVGLSAKARRADCKSSQGNEVNSILVDAYNAGKSNGIVTTTRINHATPAGAYAHSASRNWYSDADLPVEARFNGCKDLAQQFYDNSHMITVALGGGRKYFQPENTFDPEYPTRANKREDGQDLIAQWLDGYRANGTDARYVWNKADFDKADPDFTDRLLGLFEDSDMKYEADRSTDKAGEPSLAEMTEKALRMLQKNEKGYFLLVEGGRIDHGHHATNAYGALHDFVAFDEAVEKAVNMTSDSDTLIIVTADHSHTFNFGGYSDRGNPIFGLAVSDGTVNRGLDRKPYTSLLYGNGIGFQGTLGSIIEPHTRENLTSHDTEARTYVQQTAVPLASETHGGEDVAILARGPMAHLFHGVHQQSYIAYVMRFASCLGTDIRHCQGVRDDSINPAVLKTSSLTDVTDPIPEFLGLNLNATQVEIALYVQFALLVTLFVFSAVMTFIAFTALSKLRQGGPVAKKHKNYGKF